jgi:hypothetical protein
MKEEILNKLKDFQNRLKSLKRLISVEKTKTVNKQNLRKEADSIATMWVEELRSPLEHKFKLDKDLISRTAENIKHLHIISRPSNLASSYFKIIDEVLKNFDNKFILPIKQTSFAVEKILDLSKIITTLPNPDESSYLKEAIDCAYARHYRASIVMGWCCAIDRIQRTLMSIGLSNFNAASTKIKNQTKGKFKHWNKEFNFTTLSELQTVFDSDLITILEGMELVDGNQSQRLDTCLQYRNHSAHPGEAPIDEPHIITFFTDINSIILQNPKFK